MSDFMCPECKSPTLAIVGSLELPSDSRSDEITAQAITCATCGLTGGAAYEESHRGSLGSDDWTHLGYRLPADRAKTLRELIKSCPNPTSRRARATRRRATVGRGGECAKWYRLAAARGYANAQSNLGAMYYNGQGVAQDYVRALMWWNVAAARGYADATRNRDTFSKRMTPQQIAQAKELAQRCEASKYKQCE